MQRTQLYTAMKVVLLGWFAAWNLPSVIAEDDSSPLLDHKTNVVAKKSSIDDVLKQICDQHKLTLTYDLDSIMSQGFATDQPVRDFEVQGVTLKSALRLTLDRLYLSYEIQGKTLLVDAKERRFQRVHSLAGLNLKARDLLPFREAIESVCVEPWESRHENEGRFLKLTTDEATVNHTPSGHDEFAAIIRKLAILTEGRPRPPTPTEEAEALIRRSISQPLKFRQEEASLVEIGEEIRSQLKINVVVEWDKVWEAGHLDRDGDKFTVERSELPATEILEKAFSYRTLVWSIRNESLVITSREDAENVMTVRVYDTNSIKVKIDDFERFLVDNKDWDPWKGAKVFGGGFSKYGSVLLIRQTEQTHPKIRKAFGLSQ